MITKKIIAGVVSAVLAAASLLASVYGSECVALAEDEANVHSGDVNNDGTVDSRDAVICLKEYANQLIGTGYSLPSEQIEKVEVDGDGVLTSKDAVIILKYYAFSLVSGIENAPMDDFIEQDTANLNLRVQTNASSKSVEGAWSYSDTISVSWNSTNADSYVVYVIGGDGTKGSFETVSETSVSIPAWYFMYYADWQKGIQIGVSGVKNGIEYSMHTSDRIYNDDFIYWYAGRGCEDLKRAAKTNRKNTYTLIEYYESGNVTSTKRITTPKKDLNALQKFMSENFKPGWTDEMKVFYTFFWIHYIVDYDYDYKISMAHGNSDSIFNYRTGQCWQYNGALVELMTYLGYEMVLKHYPGHFTGYVIIDGKEYNMETGNYKKNGEWMSFCEHYEPTEN